MKVLLLPVQQALVDGRLTLRDDGQLGLTEKIRLL